MGDQTGIRWAGTPQADGTITPGATWNLWEGWNPGEEWRLVPGFPKYGVTISGRVFSGMRTKSGPKLMRPIPKKPYGHRYVMLYNGSGARGAKTYVHVLVLSAFSRPPLPGEECRHKDGHPENNHLDNLCWGTHQQNMDDARARGAMPRGEQHQTAALGMSAVLAIRSGERGSSRALGRKYGCSHVTIQKVRRRESWQWLAEGSAAIGG